jgi:hypothetical protein
VKREVDHEEEEGLRRVMSAGGMSRWIESAGVGGGAGEEKWSVEGPEAGCGGCGAAASGSG